jgi:hypothetical protein
VSLKREEKKERRKESKRRQGKERKQEKGETERLLTRFTNWKA